MGEQVAREGRGAALWSASTLRSGKVATVARCTATTGAMPCVRCVRAGCYVRRGSFQLFLSCNTTSPFSNFIEHFKLFRKF